MRAQLTRRGLLGGLICSMGGVALASPVTTSLRPRLRPAPLGAGPPLRPALEEVVARAGLGAGGVAGVEIRDMDTGTPIASVASDAPLPPASVTKALTSLYALELLGGDHRFTTRVLASGPVRDGLVQGDLVLAGGGDPTLTTDHLADLVGELAAQGITGITGRFLCWGGALPHIEEIEPSQLDHLGYNPSVSGLNLNFNRVHFEWARDGRDYEITLDARTARYRPDVGMSRVRVSARSHPVYTYEGPDDWTVARAALGEGGARWLPVRRPALYAGDVFRTLARAQGVRLPEPAEVGILPKAVVLARHDSDALRVILGDMMEYSTNLTAEVCGLAATRTRLGRPVGLHTSAAAMSTWLRRTYGIGARLADHSGLSDASRITAADMVKVLRADGPEGALRPLLKPIPMLDDRRQRIANHPVTVVAKTGTLNFVSTLAGIVTTPDGRDLAFAIFTANLDRRAAGKEVNDEVPEGARPWNRRSRALQQEILQRWGLVRQG
ncbi:D-alanyl-D-alanine carboxypeptidase/D-alanyl-D-alanine endopeptidase [Salibaculum sp.]|uniref:D-alanyl-D-alanine carboxypeptidase/D-alanyl-D-alanine endopeptidase n=1 Tax=Salibaculum sp. TaxID=2855480 RepID=UPI002B494E98|nr:D-alanyl-D-alanine carboxypeptidase/D-alanyl-D-alanine-endopeptidase [Salibaculum sp.]HKL68457.1 D-alanyl-D-alanine carboxypeptidase/D-alanyl-D-alanine-endopeptidase [Salibaculum sp.]